MFFSNCFSTSSGVLPFAKPIRLATRNMCVSTAIVGWWKQVFRMTFAVLRPTPGSDSQLAVAAAGIEVKKGDVIS